MNQIGGLAHILVNRINKNFTASDSGIGFRLFRIQRHLMIHTDGLT